MSNADVVMPSEPTPAEQVELHRVTIAGHRDCFDRLCHCAEEAAALVRFHRPAATAEERAEAAQLVGEVRRLWALVDAIDGAADGPLAASDVRRMGELRRTSGEALELAGRHLDRLREMGAPPGCAVAPLPPCPFRPARPPRTWIIDGWPAPVRVAPGQDETLLLIYHAYPTSEGGVIDSARFDDSAAPADDRMTAAQLRGHVNRLLRGDDLPADAPNPWPTVLERAENAAGGTGNHVRWRVIIPA
jgi:hypothetical protein